MHMYQLVILSFFFNDTATTEIYTLSLHDALPIWSVARHSLRREGHVLHQGHAHLRKFTSLSRPRAGSRCHHRRKARCGGRDRKSTRLNSSHPITSYDLLFLKKKITRSPSLTNILI